jgi:hypothetical protein
MTATWRVGIVLILALVGCSGAPATTSTPFETEPVETEPFETEPLDTPLPTDEAEPTPTAAASDSHGLPLSDGNGWPVEVTADLSGTFNESDGHYSGTGPARWCGDAVMNLTGNERAFIFEFPLDPPTGNIRDVTFSADDLVPGTTTTVFHIDVGVHTAADRDPASTVVDAGETGLGDSGTGSAQLTVDGSTRTLELQAATNSGEAIRLKGICRAP